MNPHTHFLLPFAIGMVLYEFGIFSWQLALVAGIVGVLIDLDHYVEHIMHSKKNKFSLKATWNNSMKYHKFYQRSFIHHLTGGILFTIIFLVVAYFNWKIALMLAIAYYSHMLLDHLSSEVPFFGKLDTVRLKLEELYLKESYLEIGLDIILVVLIVVLLVA